MAHSRALVKVATAHFPRLTSAVLATNGITGREIASITYPGIEPSPPPPPPPHSVACDCVDPHANRVSLKREKKIKIHKSGSHFYDLLVFLLLSLYSSFG